MRLTVGALALLALGAGGGADTTANAEERRFPSVRATPIAPLPSPEPAARNDVRDRAPLRDGQGAVDGFHDRGSGTSRGIARDTDGTARGFVAPNRTGGGVVRGTDGTFRGIAPSGPARGSYSPRSYRP